jgi:hypothetical protein
MTIAEIRAAKIIAKYLPRYDYLLGVTVSIGLMFLSLLIAAEVIR